MGSALVSVRGGGRWCRLIVVIRPRCCPFLSLFVAGRCSLLSIFVLVRRTLLNGIASLALRLATGDVHSGVVALVGWACVQSWPVVHVGGFRGCSLLFAGRCVLCASLLPLLGGFRVVLGSCSRF